MLFKKWGVFLFSFLAIALFLSACDSPVYNQTEANVADVKIKTQAARNESDEDAKPAPALVVSQGMYVDRTPISLYHDPDWLSAHVVLRGDQLPFSYYSRTVAAGGGSNVLTTYQPGLDQTTSVNMNYSGTVRGALDLLASKTGYVYSLQGNTIYWQAFVTRSFDIAFAPGSSDYLMGNASGSGGGTSAYGGTGGTVSNYVSGDSSNGEFSTFKGTLSVWDDLEKTIKQMLSKDGTVVVSQATTTVTVRDRPANVDLIAQYIRNMNNNMSKQVLIKVQVLQVQLNNDYDFGINWNTVINAFKNTSFKVNGTFDNPISITSMATGATAAPNFGLQNNGTGIPAYGILLDSLNQQGKTSVVTEPRAVCLNNQVSVIRITNSVNYIASIQNTALSGTSGNPSSNNNSNTNNIGQVTSQVTPGTVVTGLTLYLLPKIMDDRVYLQVNADLSTLTKMDSLVSGSTTLGGPEVSVQHFNQRSMIRSGDTLIMSGFRQVGNQTGADQFLQSQTLGGMASTQTNKETIVLITPYILGAA